MTSTPSGDVVPTTSGACACPGTTPFSHEAGPAVDSGPGALARLGDHVLDVHHADLVLLCARGHRSQRGGQGGCRKHGAKTMVKGLRVISDFEWEFQMNHLNRTLAPDIETLYVMASPQYSFVSSSGVKES